MLTDRRASAREALRLPEFRKMWIAQTISQVGDGLTALAALVIVTRATGSTRAVATLAILLTLPQLFLGLHAGVLVDRWDRRRVMVIGDALRGLLVLGLILVTAPAHLPWLYVLVFLQAVVGVFFEPAEYALLPNLVPERLLLAANALVDTTRLVARLVGSALAGLLLGYRAGPALAFGADAASFFVAAAIVASIPWRARGVSTSARTGRMGAEVAEGIRHLFGRRMLVGIALAFSISLLGVGAFNVLFVPFLMDVIGVGTLGVGILRAVEIGGMMAGGALVTWFAARIRPPALIAVGLVTLGMSVAALALARSAWVTVLPLVVMGLSTSGLQIGATTVMQQLVPDTLRARVESALQTLLTVALTISMACAGVLGDAVGIRRVFLAAGALTVLAGAVARSMLRPASSEGRL